MGAILLRSHSNAEKVGWKNWMMGISSGFLTKSETYMSGLVWESVVGLEFRRVKLLKHLLSIVSVFAFSIMYKKHIDSTIIFSGVFHKGSAARKSQNHRKKRVRFENR